MFVRVQQTLIDDPPGSTEIERLYYLPDLTRTHSTALMRAHAPINYLRINITSHGIAVLPSVLHSVPPSIEPLTPMFEILTTNYRMLLRCFSCFHLGLVS